MINLIECQKSANIEIRLILLISPLHKRVKNNSVTNQLFARESVKIRPTLTSLKPEDFKTILHHTHCDNSDHFNAQDER